MIRQDWWAAARRRRSMIAKPRLSSGIGSATIRSRPSALSPAQSGEQIGGGLAQVAVLDKTSTAAKASLPAGRSRQSRPTRLSLPAASVAHAAPRASPARSAAAAGRRLRTVVVWLVRRRHGPMTSSISSIATPPGRRSNGVSSAKEMMVDSSRRDMAAVEDHVDFVRKLFAT